MLLGRFAARQSSKRGERTQDMKSEAAAGEDLAVAQLLADAADATASCSHGKGGGDLLLPLADPSAGLVVRDRLPSDLQQLLGAAAAAGAGHDPCSPGHQPWLLAFSCSRNTGLLMKQDKGSSCEYSTPDGTSGLLNVVYNFNGRTTLPKVAGMTAKGQQLSLVKTPGVAKLKLTARPASSGQPCSSNKVMLQAEVRVHRVTVIKHNSSPTAAAVAAAQDAEDEDMGAAVEAEQGPQLTAAAVRGKKRKRQQPPAYWRQDKSGGLLGCVALYLFPGELVTGKAGLQAPAATLQQLCGLQPLELSRAGSSGSSSGIGMLAQADDGIQRITPAANDFAAAAAAAAAGGMSPVGLAGFCSPSPSFLDCLELAGLPGADAACGSCCDWYLPDMDPDVLLSPPTRPHLPDASHHSMQQLPAAMTRPAASPAAGGLTQLVTSCATPPPPPPAAAQLLLPLPPPAVAAAGHFGGAATAAQGSGEEGRTAATGLAPAAGLQPVSAAAQAIQPLQLPANAAQLPSSSSSSSYAAAAMRSSLMPLAKQARLLSAVHSLSNRAAKLRYDLLALAAGKHGEASITALHQLMQRVQEHNADPGLAPDSTSRVCLLKLSEEWHLRRHVLHLLCSTVRDFGPHRELQLVDSCGSPWLSGHVRQQLLNEVWRLASSSSSSSSSMTAHGGSDHAAALVHGSSEAVASSSGVNAAAGAMLWLKNVNQATCWLTACHYCIPEVLDWLLALRELTSEHMTAMTQNGRMLYHVCCRESAERGGSTQHQEGLAKTLDGLAVRLSVWLQDMRAHRPCELQQLQQEVVESLEQPQQALALAQQQGLPGSSSSSSWDSEVLWWLQYHVLFHTDTPHKYDHELLDSTVMRLFGFKVRRQAAVVSGC